MFIYFQFYQLRLAVLEGIQGENAGSAYARAATARASLFKFKERKS
jgi:hypothetical protein